MYLVITVLGKNITRKTDFSKLRFIVKQLIPYIPVLLRFEEAEEPPGGDANLPVNEPHPQDGSNGK